MNYPIWSDLHKPSIVPPLGGRRTPNIPPIGVLVSAAQDFDAIRFKWEQSIDLSVPFFLSRLLTIENQISVVGPYIGAPYGVMLLEALIVKGVKQIIILGWCGALTHDNDPGDFILPQKAFCDEGTSRHYQYLEQSAFYSFPDKKLSENFMSFLQAEQKKIFYAPIWTTDAIYRETRDKVNFFKKQGIIAVEMECSALFSVAAYRQISITALLIISDSLAEENWDPGFRIKNFKQARANALDAVISFAFNLT